jgi:hypothetical protein
MPNLSSKIKKMKANAKKSRDRYLQTELPTHQLIYLCVDSSTIRSFQAKKKCVLIYRPLSIFRAWAWTYLNSPKTKDLLKTRDFYKLRKGAFNGLMRYWEKHDGGEPSFAQFNKLIDLFFKHLCLWEDLKINSRKFIFDNTNSPLDYYSLDLLRSCKPGLAIPEDVRMGFVTPENYNLFQNEIKEICHPHPSLIFDLFAWNSRNKTKQIPKEFLLIRLDDANG